MKAKAYVGIDPGASGAMAILVDVGKHLTPAVAIVDWDDEVAMFTMLQTWKVFYDVQAVAMEDTPAMKRDSKQSATTFQQHCGAWKCLVKLAGFEPVMVKPRAWMKRRIRSKRSAADKPSLEYVAKRYPYVQLEGPRGGYLDGRSDAICIAEWCKEYIDGWR